MDDIWYTRRENGREEFPFAYPAMPRRFRFLRALSRGLLLLQRGSGGLMGLSLLGAGIFVLLGRVPPAGLEILRSEERRVGKECYS